MIYKTPLSWRFCGSRFAYVYAIYSIEHKLCYVGQTNDSVGVIGRLSGHLSKNGTFRTHFETIVGLPLDDVSDLVIISGDLFDIDLFTSSSSSYREGVEYMVKNKLMKLLAEKEVYLRLIGETRALSTNSLKYINDIAEDISHKMFEEINNDYLTLKDE